MSLLLSSVCVSTSLRVSIQSRNLHVRSLQEKVLSFVGKKRSTLTSSSMMIEGSRSSHEPDKNFSKTLPSVAAAMLKGHKGPILAVIFTGLS